MTSNTPTADQAMEYKIGALEGYLLKQKLYEKESIHG